MCAMKEGSSNQVSNLISLPGISYCLHDINQIKKFFYKWGFPSPHNVKKRVTAHGCRKKDIIKRIFELKECSFHVSSCCLLKPRHVTIIIMYCVLFFERIFRRRFQPVSAGSPYYSPKKVFQQYLVHLHVDRRIAQNA